MTSGQFVLQIVGITEAQLLCRPSKRFPSIEALSDIRILKDNREIVAHTPSLDGDGISETGWDILVAPCPPDEEEEHILDQMRGETFTHTIFMSIFREINLHKNDPKPPPKPKKIKEPKTDGSIDSDFSDLSDDDDDNEQFIAINPKIAIEVMESAIEKHLMKALPPVKQFKRNVHMRLEGKVDSSFSFVGFCTDDVPFVMEVYNVPYADYTHGKRVKEDHHFNSKTAYFPAKNCSDEETAAMVKKIGELTTIKKESVTRCLLGYVIERTDIDRLQFSAYNDAYRAAVINAVEWGVSVVPLVVSWTKEGVAFYVTDQLPVVYPTMD